MGTDRHASPKVRADASAEVHDLMTIPFHKIDGEMKRIPESSLRCAPAGDNVSLESYRGWAIDQNFIGEWTATSPDYDASYEGPEDGWVDNGLSTSARTLQGLYAEVDAILGDDGSCLGNPRQNGCIHCEPETACRIPLADASGAAGLPHSIDEVGA